MPPPLTSLVLYVSDLDESLRFYTALGLDFLEDDRRKAPDGSARCWRVTPFWNCVRAATSRLRVRDWGSHCPTPAPPVKASERCATRSSTDPGCW